MLKISSTYVSHVFTNEMRSESVMITIILQFRYILDNHYNDISSTIFMVAFFPNPSRNKNCTEFQNVTYIKL